MTLTPSPLMLYIAGCSLQDIFTEMMNSWLVSHGEPEMYDSEGNEL